MGFSFLGRLYHCGGFFQQLVEPSGGQRVFKSGMAGGVASGVADRVSLNRMRIKLNLSSRPFQNHRLFWLAVVAALLMSIFVGLRASSERAALRERAAKLQSQIRAGQEEADRRRREEEKRKREEEQIKLSQEEALQLAAARRILWRKSFSWEQMMNDLEGHVPKDARLVSVKVAGISPDGMAAKIEVGAVGKTAGQMTEMMLSLERSGGRFMIDGAMQGQMTDKGEVPFTLALEYHRRRDSR